jgi:hypothetical protein
VASFLRQHGADVNVKNNVSTATCGLLVMVKMIMKHEVEKVVVCFKPM